MQSAWSVRAAVLKDYDRDFNNPSLPRVAVVGKVGKSLKEGKGGKEKMYAQFVARSKNQTWNLWCVSRES